MATEKDSKWPKTPAPAKADPKKFEPHHQQNHPALKDEAKMFPKTPGTPEVKAAPGGEAATGNPDKKNKTTAASSNTN